MNRLLLFIGCCLVCLNLAGCSWWQALMGEPSHWKVASEQTVGKNRQQLDPVTYFGFLRTLPGTELEANYPVVKERFAADGNDDDRWRLVFFSLLPGYSFSDWNYALKLLQQRPQGEDVEDDPQRMLAELLTLVLLDRQDLDGKWKTEKERADKLAKQLQELQEIEEILSERNKKYPADHEGQNEKEKD